MTTVSAVSQHIRALHDPSARVGIQAVNELVAMGAPAVHPLIVCLSSGSAVTRWRAIVALAWIGDSQAVEPLVEALSDPVWEVRQSAAWALGQLGDRRAINALRLTLRNEDEQIRALAAYALALLGDREGLQSARSEFDERARRVANAALSLLASETQNPGQQNNLRVPN